MPFLRCPESFISEHHPLPEAFFSCWLFWIQSVSLSLCILLLPLPSYLSCQHFFSAQFFIFFVNLHTFTSNTKLFPVCWVVVNLKRTYYAFSDIIFHVMCFIADCECKTSAEFQKNKVHDKRSYWLPKESSDSEQLKRNDSNSRLTFCTNLLRFVTINPPLVIHWLLGSRVTPLKHYSCSCLEKS